MPFELSPTSATLTSVTPRTEVHGDDRVFAISLGIKITGANTMLDKLSPTLRPTLYKAVEGQDVLPGVEESTPLLRCRGIEQLTIAGSMEGWTLTVDHGIDESEPITLGGCRVDKFRVIPSEGGTVELLFRVGSSDIDATEAGLLCSHLSQEISITLAAPVRNENPVIDGTVDAFKADHPEAGDLFAAGASDQHVGDFGQADDAPGTGSSDDWPADGGDIDGGDSDAGAAEFEAGVQKSLDDAGVAPRGRRPRKPATIQ